ncbi:MAG: hypothetical protein LIQ31_01770 [Planctomycetes bacterium]|nr:hypothetical protein [Planctomycetota bacterium]
MWNFLKIFLFALMLSVSSAFSNDDVAEIEAPEIPAVLMPPIPPCSCMQNANPPSNEDDDPKEEK